MLRLPQPGFSGNGTRCNGAGCRLRGYLRRHFADYDRSRTEPLGFALTASGLLKGQRDKIDQILHATKYTKFGYQCQYGNG